MVGEKEPVAADSGPRTDIGRTTAAAPTPNGLALAWWAGSEAVDLDAAGDVDDAGLIFFAGGEVADLLGGSWAGPVGPVADEEARVEDLE